MCRHISPISLAFAILLTAMAQSGVEGQSARSDRTASTPWSPPRTADGRPSLEGVWENNSATPLERPAQLANKPRLTDEELASMERRARELFTPESDAVFGDGLYLALLAHEAGAGLGRDRHLQSELASGSLLRTPHLADRRSGRRQAAAGYGRRSNGHAGRSRHDSGELPRRRRRCRIQDRCIHYGFPDLFAAYMSVYRIVQTPDYVAIQMEKIHDTRDHSARRPASYLVRVAPVSR